MKITFPTADAFLGNSSERYFAEGFKSFHTSIDRIKEEPEQLSGTLDIHYTGPARPDGEPPHVGSIEYMAIFLRLATHTLNRLGRIGIEDTDRAFLTQYHLHVQHTLGMGRHPFSCRILESRMDLGSLQGSRSKLEIGLGGNICHLEIDHRGGYRYRILPEEQQISIDFEQLHSMGYKFSDLRMHSIEVDPDRLYIKCGVDFRYRIEENILHGIGSSRDALLPTNALTVFGQLMQILYYHTADTDRHSCPNIWLRRMQLNLDRPLFSNACTGEVYFDSIREVETKESRWKLINLYGKVGNFEGKFEVAHQIRLP